MKEFLNSAILERVDAVLSVSAEVFAPSFIIGFTIPSVSDLLHRRLGRFGII